MRRPCLTFIALLSVIQFSYGQWTTGGTTTLSNVGIGTSSPTHLLTIGSNGTASTAWYNTTDQTGVFQRLVVMQPSGSDNDNGAWEFKTQQAGPSGGVFKGIELETHTGDFRILGYPGSGNADNSGFDVIVNASAPDWSAMRFVPTIGASSVINSGINNMMAILGNVQQSGSAGYRGLNISAYEVTIGTGIHYLVDVGTTTAPTGGTYTSKFTVNDNGGGYYMGNVGIGTTTPDAKVTVNGAVHAKLVNLDLNIPAPDYVFEKNYKLKPLSEVNRYIALNHHLPSIPSAKDIAQKGINVTELSMQLLQKVEELTLYTIISDKAVTDENITLAQDQLQLKAHQVQIDLLMKQVALLSKGKTK